jgi:hypothetical protein
VRVVVVFALVLAACGGPSEEQAPTNFIALQKDFADYESWPSYAVSSPGLDGMGTHPTAPRTLYINKLPLTGSAQFPVGTMIVKVTPVDGAEPQTLAMAKRGGDFNASGATGWEWFELQKSTTGVPVILWRGVGAPAGHRYSEVNSSCNDCHGMAQVNDFVRSAQLQLAGF